MDLETPAWNKRKSEVVASHGQGHRAVRQVVSEGGSEREALRRLVEVLATLSLVNAAELRELTATVFKTYLVPCAEPVAVAMAEAGRFYHETAGAIKDRPEAERAEAHEQLGPPFVVDAHRVLPRPDNTPARASTGERDPEARPGTARTLEREASKLQHRCGRSRALGPQTGIGQSAYG